jgi:hypothetical protein
MVVTHAVEGDHDHHRVVRARDGGRKQRDEQR